MIGPGVGVGVMHGGGARSILERAALALTAARYSGSGTTFPEAYGRFTATLGGATGTPTFNAGPPAYFSTVAANNQYIELPDDNTFDFALGESFTLAIMGRWAATPTVSTAVFAKTGAFSTQPGYSIRHDGAGKMVFRVTDGTNAPDAFSPTLTAGAWQVLVCRRDVVADQIRCFLDDVGGTAVADSTTGTLANALAPRLGRLSSSGTAGSTGDFAKMLLLREAVPDADIPALTAAVRLLL